MTSGAPQRQPDQARAREEDPRWPFPPYLNFGGNCREAFTRYQEIFGGELWMLPMSDMPGDEPAPAGHADLILHAALTFGEHLLMASDSFADDFARVEGMYVAYTDIDVPEAERVFAALTDGGEVENPLEDSFFSPAFGVCRDRFGIPWMIVAAQPTGN